MCLDNKERVWSQLRKSLFREVEDHSRYRLLYKPSLNYCRTINKLLQNHRQTIVKPPPNHHQTKLASAVPSHYSFRQVERRNYFSILAVQNTDFGVVIFEYESPQAWLIGAWFQLLATDAQDFRLGEYYRLSGGMSACNQESAIL